MQFMQKNTNEKKSMLNVTLVMQSVGGRMTAFFVKK